MDLDTFLGCPLPCKRGVSIALRQQDRERPHNVCFYAEFAVKIATNGRAVQQEALS